MMKHEKSILLVALATLVVLSLILSAWVNPVAAQASPPAPPTLPKVIGITSNPLGSAFYACTAALGKTITQVSGMNVRILGGSTVVEMLAPLVSKQYQFCFASLASAHSASAAWDHFSEKDWGPQPMRIVWLSNPPASAGYVRANSGIKTWNDVKGKRVGYVPGNFGYNIQTIAMLAFGGITPDDVEVLKMPGIMPCVKGPLEGTTDFASGKANGSYVYELKASPHGVHYIQLDPADKEGWRRLHSVAPFIVPVTARVGPGIDKEHPVNTVGYQNLIFCYDWVDENLVYNVTKALYKRPDIYMSMHVDFQEYSRESSIDFKKMSSYITPFHPGAVKYLREEGLWAPEFEKWQNEQLEKERKRMAAWKAGTLAIVKDVIQVWREASKGW